MRWLTLDLPEAIQVRDRFLPPTDRLRRIAMNAFEPDWMEHVDDQAGLFVVAQGLLMYFSIESVRHLLFTIAGRFPGAEMMFDIVPRWVAEGNQRGHRVTELYTSPAMRWGLDGHEIVPTLRSWIPGLQQITCASVREPTGRPRLLEATLDVLLLHRLPRPSIVHIKF